MSTTVRTVNRYPPDSSQLNGNKTAISDVGVAAYLAESSLRAAMLSIDINQKLIKDQSFLEKILS